MTVSRRLAALAAAAVAAATLGTSCGGGRPDLRLGAVFPLSGSQAPLAREEYRGVDIARALVDDGGGVQGRRVDLDVRDLESPGAAQGVLDSLRGDGVAAVLGAYSSQLSIPASTAAARDGLVYWEAGAVADRLTGRGLPTVFRVGATGTNLGANSARFAAEQVAPRLGKTPATLRVSVVWEDDAYGRSVAEAAEAQASAEGARVVSRTPYDAYSPDWPGVLSAVRDAGPDVLILASYIPDGVAFRRAMLVAHLRVGALIGSTMAECGPEFGAMLGPDAVGVFASDRPGGGFNPSALGADGASAYRIFAARWRAETGTAPTEEGLAGFSAAWALLHDVLPAARTLEGAGIAAAARSADLPEGSLPNGAGLRFSRDPAEMGQNVRASAVIWQWQAVRHSVVVWPPAYADGVPRLVPLPA